MLIYKGFCGITQFGPPFIFPQVSLNGGLGPSAHRRGCATELDLLPLAYFD